MKISEHSFGELSSRMQTVCHTAVSVIFIISGYLLCEFMAHVGMNAHIFATTWLLGLRLTLLAPVAIGLLILSPCRIRRRPVRILHGILLGICLWMSGFAIFRARLYARADALWFAWVLLVPFIILMRLWFAERLVRYLFFCMLWKDPRGRTPLQLMRLMLSDAERPKSFMLRGVLLYIHIRRRLDLPDVRSFMVERAFEEATNRQARICRTFFDRKVSEQTMGSEAYHRRAERRIRQMNNAMAAEIDMSGIAHILAPGDLTPSAWRWRLLHIWDLGMQAIEMLNGAGMQNSSFYAMQQVLIVAAFNCPLCDEEERSICELIQLIHGGNAEAHHKHLRDMYLRFQKLLQTGDMHELLQRAPIAIALCDCFADQDFSGWAYSLAEDYIEALNHDDCSGQDETQRKDALAGLARVKVPAAQLIAGVMGAEQIDKRLQNNFIAAKAIDLHLSDCITGLHTFHNDLPESFATLQFSGLRRGTGRLDGLPRALIDRGPWRSLLTSAGSTLLCSGLMIWFFTVVPFGSRHKIFEDIHRPVINSIGASAICDIAADPVTERLVLGTWGDGIHTLDAHTFRAWTYGHSANSPDFLNVCQVAAMNGAIVGLMVNTNDSETIEPVGVTVQTVPNACWKTIIPAEGIPGMEADQILGAIDINDGLILFTKTGLVQYSEKLRELHRIEVTGSPVPENLSHVVMTSCVVQGQQLVWVAGSLPDKSTRLYAFMLDGDYSAVCKRAAEEVVKGEKISQITVVRNEQDEPSALLVRCKSGRLFELMPAHPEGQWTMIAGGDTHLDLEKITHVLTGTFEQTGTNAVWLVEGSGAESWAVRARLLSDDESLPRYAWRCSGGIEGFNGAVEGTTPVAFDVDGQQYMVAPAVNGDVFLFHLPDNAPVSCRDTELPYRVVTRPDWRVVSCDTLADKLLIAFEQRDGRGAEIRIYSFDDFVRAGFNADSMAVHRSVLPKPSQWNDVHSILAVLKAGEDAWMLTREGYLFLWDYDRGGIQSDCGVELLKDDGQPIGELLAGGVTGNQILVVDASRQIWQGGWSANQNETQIRLRPVLSGGTLPKGFPQRVLSHQHGAELLFAEDGSDYAIPCMLRLLEGRNIASFAHVREIPVAADDLLQWRTVTRLPYHDGCAGPYVGLTKQGVLAVRDESGWTSDVSKEQWDRMLPCAGAITLVNSDKIALVDIHMGALRIRNWKVMQHSIEPPIRDAVWSGVERNMLLIVDQSAVRRYDPAGKWQPVLTFPQGVTDARLITPEGQNGNEKVWLVYQHEKQTVVRSIYNGQLQTFSWTGRSIMPDHDHTLLAFREDGGIERILPDGEVQQLIKADDKKVGRASFRMAQPMMNGCRLLDANGHFFDLDATGQLTHLSGMDCPGAVQFAGKDDEWYAVKENGALVKLGQRYEKVVTNADWIALCGTHVVCGETANNTLNEIKDGRAVPVAGGWSSYKTTGKLVSGLAVGDWLMLSGDAGVLYRDPNARRLIALDDSCPGMQFEKNGPVYTAWSNNSPLRLFMDGNTVPHLYPYPKDTRDLVFSDNDVYSLIRDESGKDAHWSWVAGEGRPPAEYRDRFKSSVSLKTPIKYAFAVGQTFAVIDDAGTCALYNPARRAFAEPSDAPNKIDDLYLVRDQLIGSSVDSRGKQLWLLKREGETLKFRALGRFRATLQTTNHLYGVTDKGSVVDVLNSKFPLDSEVTQLGGEITEAFAHERCLFLHDGYHVAVWNMDKQEEFPQVAEAEKLLLLRNVLFRIEKSGRQEFVVYKWDNDDWKKVGRYRNLRVRGDQLVGINASDQSVEFIYPRGRVMAARPTIPATIQLLFECNNRLFALDRYGYMFEWNLDAGWHEVGKLPATGQWFIAGTDGQKVMLINEPNEQGAVGTAVFVSPKEKVELTDAIDFVGPLQPYTSKDYITEDRSLIHTDDYVLGALNAGEVFKVDRIREAMPGCNGDVWMLDEADQLWLYKETASGTERTLVSKNVKTLQLSETADEKVVAVGWEKRDSRILDDGKCRSSLFHIKYRLWPHVAPGHIANLYWEPSSNRDLKFTAKIANGRRNIITVPVDVGIREMSSHGIKDIVLSSDQTLKGVWQEFRNRRIVSPLNTHGLQRIMQSEVVDEKGEVRESMSSFESLALQFTNRAGHWQIALNNTPVSWGNGRLAVDAIDAAALSGDGRTTATWSKAYPHSIILQKDNGDFHRIPSPVEDVDRLRCADREWLVKDKKNSWYKWRSDSWHTVDTPSSFINSEVSPWTFDEYIGRIQYAGQDTERIQAVLGDAFTFDLYMPETQVYRDVRNGNSDALYFQGGSGQWFKADRIAAVKGNTLPDEPKSDFVCDIGGNQLSVKKRNTRQASWNGSPIQWQQEYGHMPWDQVTGAEYTRDGPLFLTLKDERWMRCPGRPFTQVNLFSSDEIERRVYCQRTSGALEMRPGQKLQWARDKAGKLQFSVVAKHGYEFSMTSCGFPWDDPEEVIPLADKEHEVIFLMDNMQWSDSLGRYPVFSGKAAASAESYQRNADGTIGTSTRTEETIASAEVLWCRDSENHLIESGSYELRELPNRDMLLSRYRMPWRVLLPRTSPQQLGMPFEGADSVAIDTNARWIVYDGKTQNLAILPTSGSAACESVFGFKPRLFSLPGGGVNSIGMVQAGKRAKILVRSDRIVLDDATFSNRIDVVKNTLDYAWDDASQSYFMVSYASDKRIEPQHAVTVPGAALHRVFALDDTWVGLFEHDFTQAVAMRSQERGNRYALCLKPVRHGKDVVLFNKGTWRKISVADTGRILVRYTTNGLDERCLSWRLKQETPGSSLSIEVLLTNSSVHYDSDNTSQGGLPLDFCHALLPYGRSAVDFRGGVSAWRLQPVICSKLPSAFLMRELSQTEPDMCWTPQTNSFIRQDLQWWDCSVPGQVRATNVPGNARNWMVANGPLKWYRTDEDLFMTRERKDRNGGYLVPTVLSNKDIFVEGQFAFDRVYELSAISDEPVFQLRSFAGIQHVMCQNTGFSMYDCDELKEELDPAALSSTMCSNILLAASDTLSLKAKGDDFLKKQKMYHLADRIWFVRPSTVNWVEFADRWQRCCAVKNEKESK